jgi:hypothetical protein
MKKIVLLLLFLPFSIFANFYSGTITFNDNSTKKGLIEIPDDPTNQNLKFKSEEKGKVEKFNIDDIIGFIIPEDSKTISQYVSIYLAEGTVFNPGEFKKNKKKSWARVEKKGKITLYSTYLGYRKAVITPKNTQSGWPSQTRFYVQKPNEETANFYFLHMQSAGTSFAINNYKVLKKMTKYHFEKECPNLENLVNIKDFKKNGITRIVDLYDENCGK